MGPKLKLRIQAVSSRQTLLSYLGDDALPNGLDVTFEVTELRRLTGSYNTMVGNNEGSMVRHGRFCPPCGTFSFELLKRGRVLKRGGLRTLQRTSIRICEITRAFSLVFLELICFVLERLKTGLTSVAKQE